MLILHCPKHREYTGSLRPRIECKLCQLLFDTITTAIRGGLEAVIYLSTDEARRLSEEMIEKEKNAQKFPRGARKRSKR